MSKKKESAGKTIPGATGAAEKAPPPIKKNLQSLEDLQPAEIRPQGPFPVAGIGASAGGLEAYEKFFLRCR